MGRVQHLDDSSDESGNAKKKARSKEFDKGKIDEDLAKAKTALAVVSNPAPVPRLPTGDDIPDWLRDDVPAAMPGMPGLNPALTGMPGLNGFGGMPAFSSTAALSGLMAAEQTKADIARMDFSKPTKDLDTNAIIAVHKDLIKLLMTNDNKKLLEEESGAAVEWLQQEGKVNVSGSPEQVQKAQKLLGRVSTHSRWGVSADKITRCIRPRKVESILCRLSAMGTLPAAQKTLNAAHPTIKMGKGPENHVILPNPYKVVSRAHCVLEFDEDRGAVYIFDCSTNGTFLNQRRLPPKEKGKILLSHGDELMFKDPLDKTKHEFGYMVNLEEISAKKDMALTGPRRIHSAEEMNRLPGDLR